MNNDLLSQLSDTVSTFYCKARKTITDRTINVKNKFGYHETSDDTDTIEIYDFDEILTDVRDVIIESENDEEISLYKKLLKQLKANRTSLTQTVKYNKQRELGGYSEYTCWMETVSADEIESVDESALMAEIEQFENSFKED